MKTLRLSLALLFLVSLVACNYGPSVAQIGLVDEVPKPSLPAFDGTVPTFSGTLNQDRNLQRGDEIYLQNGTATIWIFYLGVTTEGRPKWDCESNSPNHDLPCQQYVDGTQVFYWEGTAVGNNPDEGGNVYVDGEWVITYSQP